MDSPPPASSASKWWLMCPDTKGLSLGINEVIPSPDTGQQLSRGEAR